MTASNIPPAHALIHLIQCPQCSLLLRSPVRLPCGNTLCRACLPPTRKRTGITYPAGEGRKEGFHCFWAGDGDCDGEHCLGDCGVDVLLTNLVELYAEILGSGNADGKGRVRWMSPSDEGSRIRSAVVDREWLTGVYALAREGRFDYNARTVVYEEMGNIDNDRARTTFERLREGIRNELDCHVCYSLILDPLTTACGHTFCRKCVGQILTHSDLCPVCRRKLNIAPNVCSEPKNKRIADLVEVLFVEQIDARREGAAQDEPDAEKGIPLFVCTLAFPTMPTFLHVYERRYRIMLRRIMESGNRQFGMVAYNATNRSQGDLGRAPFMQYGTLVKVDRYELLPGGRSLVIATGVSRFKIVKSETVDGYHVGRIERVDDISLTEEERVESMETSEITEASSMEGVPEDILLDSMSTQQLSDLAIDFVRRKREEGAPWLHPRIFMAYGDLPTDPAQFPWWFASVVPVPEDFKYALLSTSSVRQRLKVTARWIKRLDDRRWYVCSPFY